MKTQADLSQLDQPILEITKQKEKQKNDKAQGQIILSKIIKLKKKLKSQKKLRKKNQVNQG